MTPRLRALLLVSICFVPASTARAHDVVVEQVVQLNAQVQSGHLMLQVQVPLGAIADAALSRREDGTLAADADPAALLIVAGDAVRNLDVRQDDQPLRAPHFTAHASSDRSGLDIDIDFAVSGAQGLSARLNAFSGTALEPVVSVLRFRETGGSEQVMRVSGPASRVLMNPDIGDAFGRFATAGARLSLTWSDSTLLLLCLLAVPLTARAALRAVAALVAGQAVGLLVYAAAPTTGASYVQIAVALSASFVVVAGLQLVVQARRSYISALTMGFGVLSGVGLGRALSVDVAFAGAHAVAGVTAFALAIIGIELWLAAVFFATRGWLSGVGGAPRVVAYAVAAFVAHTAIHHFMDAGTVLEQNGSFLATHALVLVTLAWAFVMLALAAREALRSGPPAHLDAIADGSAWS